MLKVYKIQQIPYTEKPLIGDLQIFRFHILLVYWKICLSQIDVTIVNVHDGTMYKRLVKSLIGLVENILADPAYDDSKLYQFSDMKHLRLITPIK